MPCYHPIPATLEYSRRAGEEPKRSMHIHPAGEPSHWLPCGKCIGCREIQQQQLALRITHEARSHAHAHFLTLTYTDEKLPDGLQKRDMQLFWKRLRKATTNMVGMVHSNKIKHLTCGEYGERTHRPHYHAAVLGLAIKDLKKWDSENHTSSTIDQIWKNGIVTISELTEQRINYVAGYVLKKAGYQKQIYCDEDGVELQAPYRDMSKGLGKEWIDKYQTDLRNGYLQHNQQKYTIPRYYRDRISKTNQQLKEYIENKQAQQWKESTPEDRKRLHDGEKIRLKTLKERHRDRV